MAKPKYLVGVYTVTAGLHEDLGSDEQEVILFSWMAFHVNKMQVVASQTHVVKPSGCDVNENVLSEACKVELGINEEKIKMGQPLEQVIDQLDYFVRSKLSCDSGGPPSFQLVTDGQMHLRQVLHPEASHKNIHLPRYYYSFFDIRKHFRKCYHPTEDTNSLQDILKHLGLESDQSAEFSMQQVQNIAKIIARMIEDGHSFDTPELIHSHLEPGLCTKNEVVDNNTVVRARGLPWQSSDQDIAKFFRGLNIVRGGVALCLSPQGRRNGEALVRFESQEHRDMALKRHKHHIGQRYIEVYRASGDDFINVAGGNNNEAQAFLSRGAQVIVRMRGLPYDCTHKQVMLFFSAGDPQCEVMDGEEGVLFVKKLDGRATGDAFVLFATEDMAQRALTKHRDVIGSRYIELFRSTTAEVQQVLNRSLDPRSFDQPQQPLLTALPQLPLLSAQQLQLSPASRKDCIRLRGLPFEAQVEQILEFLGEHSKNIVYQGVHMVYNAQGQPSGEAFIQMDTEHSAFIAAQQRHHRYMVFGKKQRYIEVFQCSVDDMTLVLSGGMPVQRSIISPGGNILPPQYTAFPYVQTPQIVPAVTPITPRLPTTSYYPIFYWPYPSPPVSPTTYYSHSATTVLTADCIQVQRNNEIRANGDAMVNFPNARLEAERVLHHQEKSRQNMNNRYIELFMA